jgi:hypothetical protein
MLQILLEILGVAAAAAIKRVFARTFAGPVQKLTLQERRDDPVYRRNLQRLIELNNQSEVRHPQREKA